MSVEDMVMLLIVMDIMEDGELDLFGALDQDDADFDMDINNMDTDYDSGGFDGGDGGDFGGGGASGDY
jgi:hypothetical protein